MNSRSVVLERSRPRVRRVPRSVATDADDASFLAAAYGLTPDDWQDDVLEGWMGRRSTGRWSAATCGLAVPRQNGKNGVIEVRELFGLVELGERFLHTAHEVKTARKAFLRIAGFFENERKHPELAALVADIRKTNGQEAVILRNGASVEFVARSRGSGRGFTVDVLVCDEAQELTDEELAALLPTISAAPLGNPQVILTGTPPDPETMGRGEVFRRVRADGEKDRDPRLAWTDFGVADGPLPEVDDRRLWVEVNPALSGRLNVAEVERERGLMSDETFARERLGWWGDPLAHGSVIDLRKWRGQADPGSVIVGPPVFALETAQDRATTVIAVAGRRGDGHMHVELVKYGRGSGWALDEALRLTEAWDAPIVIDKNSPAASHIATLEDAGVQVVTTLASDMARACGSFYDGITESTHFHLGDPVLERAVQAAGKRPLAGGWAWDRKSGDIAPLVAVTLAAHGVLLLPDDDPDPQVHGWPDDEELDGWEDEL
jgi:hypothetical protein